MFVNEKIRDQNDVRHLFSVCISGTETGVSNLIYVCGKQIVLFKMSCSLIKHLHQAQQIQELRSYHIRCSSRRTIRRHGFTHLCSHMSTVFSMHGWEVNYVTSCSCLYANCYSCASRAWSHVHYSTPGQNWVQKSWHFSHKSPNLPSPVSINASHC